MKPPEPTEGNIAHNIVPEFPGLPAKKIRLPVPVAELRSQYARALPFPHLIMDELFSVPLLDGLLAEIDEMRTAQWVSVDGDSRERTLRMRSAAEIGEAGANFLSIVHSAAFLHLLSEISGVGPLLPDPYLLGAGFALMRRGDYFEVHADRNVAYDTGLMRRLAMIVFLNRDWREEYNGQLELWSSDARTCAVSISPLFNRTVLFQVAYPNFHGVPAPIMCPVDRMRQSFIVYYHTTEGQQSANEKPHTTIFAPRYLGTPRATLRAVLRDAVPPFLVRILRSLRAGKRRR